MRELRRLCGVGGTPLTVDIADNHTSPTPDSEPSLQSTRCAEPKPEPNIYREPEPAVTDEPLPERATEPSIAPELEPVTPDQVQEPATDYASVDYASGSTMAPSSLLSTVACQSTSSTRLLYPPALPWLVVDYPPLHDSTPLAVPHPSVLPAAPRPSGSLPPPWLLESSASAFALFPSGSSALSWLLGSPSPPLTTSPPARPPSVGPLESSTLAPPWHFPPSSPHCCDLGPPDSSCSKSLLSSPWLLPPSDLSCSSCLLSGSSLHLICPAPHVFSLDPPSVITTQETIGCPPPVIRPPPDPPPACRSQPFTFPPLFPNPSFSVVRGRTFREGSELSQFMYF